MSLFSCFAITFPANARSAQRVINSLLHTQPPDQESSLGRSIGHFARDVGLAPPIRHKLPKSPVAREASYRCLGDSFNIQQRDNSVVMGSTAFGNFHVCPCPSTHHWPIPRLMLIMSCAEFLSRLYFTRLQCALPREHSRAWKGLVVEEGRLMDS